MKKYYLILLISLFFVSLHAQQWQYTGGPDGMVQVHDMMEYKQHKIMATDCGIFHKLPGSNSWEQRYSHSVKDLKIANDTLYFRGQYRDIYYADLNLLIQYSYLVGSSRYPGSSYFFRSLPAYDVMDSLKVFATSNTGITYAFSQSNMLNFTGNLPFDTTLSNNPYLENYDIKIVGGYIYLLTEKGLYRTDRNFLSWEAMDTNLVLNASARLRFLDNRLFITTSDSLWSSADSGRNFTFLHHFPSGLHSLEAYNGVLYVSGSNGVLRSSNGGNIWRHLNRGLTYFHAGNLIASGADLFFSNSYHGLFKLGINGWVPDNKTGLDCNDDGSIIKKDGNIFSATPQQLFKRNPAANNWQNLITQDSVRFGDLEAIGPLIVLPFYKSTTTGMAAGVMYSINDGGSWQYFNLPQSAAALDTVHIAGGSGGLYIASGHNLWFTSDYGANFQDLTNSFTNSFPLIKGLEWHQGSLYVLPSGNNVLYTYANGNWINVYNSDFHGADSYLYKMDNELLCFSKWRTLKMDSTGIFRNIAPGFSEVFSITHNAGRLYAIYDYLDMGYSPDTGKTWSSLPALSWNYLYDLAATNDSLYCMTNIGVFSYPIMDSTGVSVGKVKVDKPFRIYPNPAEDYFIVDFSNQQMADFKVFTGSGELVQTGVLEKGQRIDISDLAQGIYFIRVLLSDKWYSQKLIVN